MSEDRDPRDTWYQGLFPSERRRQGRCQGMCSIYCPIFISASYIFQLTTNGSNFRGLWHFSSSAEESIIEDDGIYSNDIYSILKTYGVEMARAAILREISGVFDAYKIDVNGRHLELIADYMVRLSMAVDNMLAILTKHVRHSTVHTNLSTAWASLPTHLPCSRLLTRRLQHSSPTRRCTVILTI